jgi:hypothetical protein
MAYYHSQVKLATTMTYVKIHKTTIGKTTNKQKVVQILTLAIASAN